MRTLNVFMGKLNVNSINHFRIHLSFLTYQKLLRIQSEETTNVLIFGVKSYLLISLSGARTR